jgi:hypothetical protein
MSLGQWTKLKYGLQMRKIMSAFEFDDYIIQRYVIISKRTLLGNTP